MSDMLCMMDGCRRTVSRRGMCWKHYQRRRRMADESNTNVHQQASTPLGPCCCEEPIAGVIRIFGWGSKRYHEREPRPGDMVECQLCGRPLAEFMGNGPQP
jgi:hypothetical protein